MFKMKCLSRRFSLAVFACLLSAAMVSGQPSGAEGQKKIDPCALLTKAEIQEAVGQPVGDGKLNTKANPLVGYPCEYVVGSFGAFSLLVKPLGPGETPDNTLSQLKKQNMKYTDVPGFGDRSFFLYPGYGMLSMNTFKGSHYIIMTLLIPGMTEEQEKVPAEKLMQIVLSRL